MRNLLLLTVLLSIPAAVAAQTPHPRAADRAAQEHRDPAPAVWGGLSTGPFAQVADAARLVLLMDPDHAHAQRLLETALSNLEPRDEGRSVPLQN